MYNFMENWTEFEVNLFCIITAIIIGVVFRKKIIGTLNYKTKKEKNNK